MAEVQRLTDEQIRAVFPPWIVDLIDNPPDLPDWGWTDVTEAGRIDNTEGDSE